MTLKKKILAKIALTKLENEVKACWELLLDPDSLGSECFLDSTAEICKKIKKRALELNDVFEGIKGSPKRVDTGDEVVRPSQPYPTPETTQSLPKESIRGRGHPRKKFCKLACFVAFFFLQIFILQKVFSNSGRTRRLSSKYEALIENLDYSNKLRQEETEELRTKVIGLQNKVLILTSSSPQPSENNSASNPNQNQEEEEEKNNLERFFTLAKMSWKLKKHILKQPTLDDFEEQKIRLRDSEDPDHWPLIIQEDLVYVGSWANGNFDNFGLLYSKTGRFYFEGYFLEGKKHGLGRLILEDGNIMVGTWVDDFFTGNKISK